MRKLISLLLLLGCLTAQATDVVFTLTDFAGVSTASNRWVKIQPMSVPTANGSSVVIGSTLNYTSSISGTFTISSIASPALYFCSVMAPPSRTDFKIYVSTNNLGTIQASSILVADSTATFPAGTVAWSAASSDIRYSGSTAYPQVYEGATNIVAAPSDPTKAAVYVNTSTGVLFTWNTTTSVWF